MHLFIVGDFFRRRRPRRARDEMPAGPLVDVLLFWVSFGLGALLGGLAALAGIIHRWIVCGGSAAASLGCLIAAIAFFRKLNR
ncbi:MAG TPA: hypothetical protein VKH35_14285 [Thermoanaerobaculia bacterium]|jgi:hypothetical protein|nr:hypothetical protein [Thermoanaerobaculia bacterium]